MQIEQLIYFDGYSVRKTSDHTGELIRRGSYQGEVLCCLGCVRGDRSTEEHVVDILAACRALDITTLTAGHLWSTIIPSVTVTLVDVCGEHRTITEELEQARFEKFSRNEDANHDREDAEERVKTHLLKRRSLYLACGVPCPLGAG